MLKYYRITNILTISRLSRNSPVYHSKKHQKNIIFNPFRDVKYYTFRFYKWFKMAVLPLWFSLAAVEYIAHENMFLYCPKVKPRIITYGLVIYWHLKG